jgi:hypothetical protein
MMVPSQAEQLVDALEERYVRLDEVDVPAPSLSSLSSDPPDGSSAVPGVPEPPD